MYPPFMVTPSKAFYIYIYFRNFEKRDRSPIPADDHMSKKGSGSWEMCFWAAECMYALKKEMIYNLKISEVNVIRVNVLKNQQTLFWTKSVSNKASWSTSTCSLGYCRMGRVFLLDCFRWNWRTLVSCVSLSRLSGALPYYRLDCLRVVQVLSCTHICIREVCMLQLYTSMLTNTYVWWRDHICIICSDLLWIRKQEYMDTLVIGKSRTLVHHHHLQSYYMCGKYLGILDRLPRLMRNWCSYVSYTFPYE